MVNSPRTSATVSTMRRQQRGPQVGQEHPPQRAEPAGAERAGRLDDRLQVERAQPGVDGAVGERHGQDHVLQREQQRRALEEAGRDGEHADDQHHRRDDDRQDRDPSSSRRSFGSRGGRRRSWAA